MCPWADALFAIDRAWWRVHGEEAAAEFEGERFTGLNGALHAKQVRGLIGKNSGACAISLAEYFGARRIILIGYDCQYTGGKRHWHGDHVPELGNAVSMPSWMGQFQQVARRLGHCEIINASRATAIRFWPRMGLEAALAD